MIRLWQRLAFAAAALAAVPASASDATPWVVTPQTEVRLVAGEAGAGADGVVRLGLHFKLKDGWKIYWRRPGDAGFPPRVDWSESANLKDSAFAWPAPTRFEVLGFQTMGYAKEVVFPIAVQLVDAARPLEVRARVDYLTCDDICIPYSAQLALDVPPGSGGATRHAPLIERFAARVPGDGSADGLTIERVETAGPFKPIDEAARSGAVRVVATSTIPFVRPDVFIEGPELAFFGPPSARYSEAGRRAVITLPATVEGDTKLEQASLRITLTDGQRAAERELAATAGGAMPDLVAAPSMLVIVLFAVIGGLILNLMPCVLPVLSLKVARVAALGGEAPSRVRASFLATSAGIFLSFLAIATALVALKSAGAAVGWGVQFQHPWFIAALVVVATLFACNLWGFFEVPLPGWVGSLGGSAGRPSWTGDVATGALATVMATPCSAPFLGTAVGFALAGGAVDIYLVFSGLALGLALPYIACAALPGFARILPRPGPWMVRLKQVLALALAATALWLLSVLAAQSGNVVAAIVAILMIALAVVLGLRRSGKLSVPSAVAAGAIAVVAAIALPSAISVAPQTGNAARVAKAPDGLWQPFDPETIPGLVAQGKTVFVDITADWCITCQVNKAAVLRREPVSSLLRDAQVVAMQGDWTRPDPLIAAYLQRFGRYAIPFNAVYGPGTPDGVALSELLTSAAVLDALGAASQGALAAKK